jgi:glycerophosphoryl diester phosphodiesterase
VFTKTELQLRAWPLFEEPSYRITDNTSFGKAPLVIAHGGLSRIFPDQTQPACLAEINDSLYKAIIFCDLQLSKYGVGICRSDFRLDNSTLDSYTPIGEIIMLSTTKIYLDTFLLTTLLISSSTIFQVK